MSRKPLGQEISEEEILATAKKYFCQNGFDRTNLNDIANELHITRTPIYYYFENKYKLYEAVVKKHMQYKRDRYSSLFASDLPFFEKIRQDLNLSSHLRLSEKELFSGIGSPQFAEVKQYQTEVMHQINEMKTQYIKEAINNNVLRPDTDVDTFLVYFYVISLGVEAVNKQDGWYDMTDERIDKLIDTVVDGIAIRYKSMGYKM